MTSFRLDEEAARDWVTGLIIAYELAGLNGGDDDFDFDSDFASTPQLGMDWRPREPGQEDAVAALVRCAQKQPGILVPAQNAEVAIEFVDDGDDWSYRFLFHVRAPVPVTLISPPREVYRIGEDRAFGVDAAIGVLREAASAAAALQERLEAFVEASTRVRRPAR
ncbi:hypothetical protein Airi02_002560 [Actinoallomurus iriomotensis]|uniref:Uncharacterized protein n=1 Tax=Actinoallomurus iriomotensis TaxID=478107 RepID=A0A9W6RUZ7_9ACTN|nr:hypothetical protein Airi02_002560 [Actinoallomurus iriomotensis]